MTAQLDAVRDAISRQDWAGALDAATGLGPLASAEDEAARSDMVAEAAWWLGRIEECIAARESAYHAYDELGDVRRAGQCAVWIYEHHAISGRPVIARAWLRRARRALDADRGGVEYGALLLREAEVAHGEGDLETARALAGDAVSLGRRLRDRDLEAEALQTEGRVLIDQGAVTEGLDLLDEAMLYAVEGKLRPYSTGKVYCSLISACEDLGDLDRAAEWTEATRRWADRHPFAIWPGICRVHRAVVLKRRGALDEAEREASRACVELADTHVGNWVTALAEVGDIQRRLGNLELAEEAFEKATELCGQPCEGLALLRLAQGRVAAAMTAISACLHETPSNRLARSRLLPILVHVSIAADEIETATGALSELETIAGEFATPMLEATVLAARGRLLLATGDPATARDELRRALDAWVALDVPYEVATTGTLLGQALRDIGDEAAAVAAFASAAASFEQIGAKIDAHAVNVGRAPQLPSGLTPREVEVLRLVAAGLTNNEIATELFLSAKTVSRHLSNIFAKVGVSSRAAATAFAFEHDLVASR